MMPRMSGMELHQWLAAHEPALARRIVFLTGGAFTPRAAAYLAGIENLRIEKPVDTVTLRNLVIERVLENRESGDGASGGGRK
jgi:FixJ family two-component response regulator